MEVTRAMSELGSMSLWQAKTKDTVHVGLRGDDSFLTFTDTHDAAYS